MLKFHSKHPRQIFTRKTCSFLPSAQNQELRHLSKLYHASNPLTSSSLQPPHICDFTLYSSMVLTACIMCHSPLQHYPVCVPFWIRVAGLVSQGTTTIDLLTPVIQALFSFHIVTPQKSFTMERSISVPTCLSHSIPNLHSLCTSATTFQYLSSVLYLLKLITSLFHGALDVWWILLPPLSLEVLQKTPDTHWSLLPSPVCSIQTECLIYIPL